jgi:hypothetical protein
VAGSAGAAHVAGVFDLNAVVEQGFAKAVACVGFDLSAIGAKLDVGENFDDGHMWRSKNFYREKREINAKDAKKKNLKSLFCDFCVDFVSFAIQKDS